MSPTEPHRDAGVDVLIADRDPDYLELTRATLLRDGYTVLTVQDIESVTDYLTNYVPRLLAVQLDLLTSNPLAILESRASTPPLVVLASGPPNEAFHRLARSHEILGYHDKRHGQESFELTLKAALKSGAGRDVERLRRRLQLVIDSLPELHGFQPLDEVLEAIMDRALELTGGQEGFVATRSSDPVGKPPIEGLSDLAPTLDDYVVGPSTGPGYPKGKPVHELETVSRDLVELAVHERSHAIENSTGVLPFALSHHVLGLAYVIGAKIEETDHELLSLFGSQAAAAIRNTVLFDLATVDSTTRVFQKAFTLDRLRETLKLAWRKAFPVSVLMIDIDSFKELNDRYGHVVGDRALRHLGTLLKRNVRDSDIVGRFGGDEFLVILIDANHDGADIVAERLYHALAMERSRPAPGGIPPLLTSMGMATLEPGEVTPWDLGLPRFADVLDALVDEADSSMYAARREANGLFAGRTLTWADFVRG